VKTTCHGKISGQNQFAKESKIKYCVKERGDKTIIDLTLIKKKTGIEGGNSIFHSIMFLVN